MRLEVLTVPYRYDEREEGLGAGPGAILRAGLRARLASAGLDCGEARSAELDEADRTDEGVAVNIGRLGARTAALVAEARRAGGGALVLAGDDTAAVGVVAGVLQAEPEATIGLVWLDAHGDFNTPETSYSGILAGMPVAVIAGLAGPLWREAAGLRAPIATDRIMLAGIRELDEREEELIRATDARLVRSADLADKAAFAASVERLARRCTHLCLHVDLDVLDPRFVPSASTPSANGLTIEQAASAMAAVLATGKVASVCVSSINPGAGTRGERSVASAVEMLVRALPAWESAPAAPPA